MNSFSYLLLYSFLFSNCTHYINGQIEDHFDRCDMSKTSLNRYWTKSNLLHPEGCINRTNISIIHMDGGQTATPFYNILRDGARRICIDYDINCPDQIHGTFGISSVLPQIATDIAGSTHHGYSYIVGISLPAKQFTGLNDIHNQGVITVTSGGNQMYNQSYNPYGSSLHIRQTNYVAGYESCSKMINEFAVTNILVIVPMISTSMNTRRLACLDAIISNNLSNNSYTWLRITRDDIEYDISLVANKLLNNTNIDGIFATAIKAHDPAFYLLNRVLNTVNSNTSSLYGLTTDRAILIKCLSQVDFSPTTIDGFRANITKYASSQQPYLFGSICMLQLAIFASTGNKILFNQTLLSGPHFIETLQDALLFECTADTVRFCHDEDPINPYNNCSCIDTQSQSKIIYLFHYAGDDNSDYYTYFKIVENGALIAANDYNITLHIIVSNNVTTFNDKIKSTINDIILNNKTVFGIITPLPNNDTYNLFDHYVVSNSQNAIIGIANGYEYYKLLNIEQGNFFGADEIVSGFEMSLLLHKNYSVQSFICVDNRNGLYSSINDRCYGVNNYCTANNLTFIKINKIDDIYDYNLQLISPIGIVSPGYSTCYETQEFIKNEKLMNTTNIYIAGCFDASSKNALNGIINEDIKIIMDNQPWLIGYLSVLSAFNKLFLARHIVSTLVQTGPKIITTLDNNDIELKKCENVNFGFQFCSKQPLPSSQIDINYPTLQSFSGIFILILFIVTTLIVIFLFFAIYKYRKHKIIKTSQPLLLLFTIIGGIIMMSSGLIFLWFDGLMNNYVCNIPWSVWCIGFTMFFISYTLRVWKYVKLIEAGLNLHTRNIVTTKGVLIRLFVVVFIDILLVTLSSIFTPIQSKIHYNKVLQSTDQYNNKLTDIIVSQCQLTNNSYLWYIVFMYKLLLLIWVLMVAFRKQASNNKIKKLKWLALVEGPNI
eukprot:330761_1